MLKQIIKPLNENDIFLSTSTEQITWKELDANLDDKIKKLQSYGLGPHVVFIIQEEKTTLDNLLWILASIKNGGSATNAESTISKKELDFLVRDSGANCIIRSNNIEIVKEPTEPSILHHNEIFRGMTSGTTVKQMFELYPFFWTFEDHMNSEVDNKTLLGCTIESTNAMLLDYAPEFAENERISILQPSGFISTYSPYNMLRAYQYGGRLHHLNIGDNIADEIEKSNVNCILSFPNALKRVVDELPDDKNFNIKYVEAGGGFTPESLIKDIEKKFNLKILYNMFGSTEMDCVMKSFYRPGDPIDNFYALKPVDSNYYDIKVENDLLWYKYGTLDWHSDNDKMIEKDGKYFYNGRANDEFLIVKQGVKIYTGVVEAVALEVEGVDYVSSCEEDKIHYLIYTGNADINDVANKLNDMQRWKRPHDIYHVTEKLYYSGANKIQKRKLPGIIKSANTGIIAHINFKDHNLI